METLLIKDVFRREETPEFIKILDSTEIFFTSCGAIHIFKFINVFLGKNNGLDKNKCPNTSCRQGECCVFASDVKKLEKLVPTSSDICESPTYILHKKTPFIGKFEELPNVLRGVRGRLNKYKGKKLTDSDIPSEMKKILGFSKSPDTGYLEPKPKPNKAFLKWTVIGCIIFIIMLIGVAITIFLGITTGVITIGVAMGTLLVIEKFTSIRACIQLNFLQKSMQIRDNRHIFGRINGKFII
ncbi:MAG: hypothetical protein FWG65_00420, partial [Turicibacter sp.]|nr:hypothetical protein [Turicibacter sp.]